MNPAPCLPPLPDATRLTKWYIVNTTEQLSKYLRFIFSVSGVYFQSYIILLSYLRTDLIHQRACRRYILSSPEVISFFLKP